jgi:glutaminase
MTERRSKHLAIWTSIKVAQAAKSVNKEHPSAWAHGAFIMTTSGMYDYAGEWVYRVGMPAKSGVGGGIVAALPVQLGLGTFSPRLDEHGNSVRGLKMCEALSTHFGLHMLNRSAFHLFAVLSCGTQGPIASGSRAR